ncbi:MAG: hypothetical protein CO184_01610 [Candidatus Zambryskibacteria bacterium CG_4_9_14_3_um_filter_40_16]|uniref:Uncharacterized protein n=3 Tax=Parcubacteria group TaxID=1794811 RepID=A0A2H0US15_9BACT|nr:MAG: hypothetical protein COV95_02190 [Candidatus Zambryskibacteria bacterium CG11_big_fil_rev_8_21_14_0_20_40_24]PIR89199.1 MAG: hypothetical protein COU07_02360 [Candidatus Harrisonbacteria bacterium CG10_big_fil_rev_8_21_14_0_10_40_38]PJA33546.1 MAG: hypothetical protein CO184_01610 [Candidatus Zambryskibacteria bacterium CG_4_9_14_3_um_filter_40_16]
MFITERDLAWLAEHAEGVEIGKSILGKCKKTGSPIVRALVNRHVMGRLGFQRILMEEEIVTHVQCLSCQSSVVPPEYGSEVDESSLVFVPPEFTFPFKSVPPAPAQSINGAA